MPNKPETVTLFLCSQCKQPIMKPEDGFVVHGNIYVANPEQGGLVGNNFPEASDSPQLHRSVIEGYVDLKQSVNKTAFCKPCFCEVLGIQCSNIRTEFYTRNPISRMPDYPA